MTPITAGMGTIDKILTIFIGITLQICTEYLPWWEERFSGYIELKHKLYVTRYRKRYLRALATSYWLGINTIQS